MNYLRTLFTLACVLVCAWKLRDRSDVVTRVRRAGL